MSDPKQIYPLKVDEKALLRAWRILMEFDDMSVKERKVFKRLREWVIAITFFITFGSVATLMFNLPNFIFLVLPFVGLNLMNYTSLYHSATTWIEHRYAAEKIRSEIYQYRANAQAYSILSTNKKNNLLMENINKIFIEAPHGVSDMNFSYGSERDEKFNTAFKALLENSNGDDGFIDLTSDAGFEQYIKTRIHAQLSWYEGKVNKDYREGKNVTKIAIIFSAVGSIIAVLFGITAPIWVGLLAIVNAIGVMINALSNVYMSGRTYGVYYKKANELKAVENAWSVFEDDDEMQNAELKQQKRIELVDMVEKILMEELDIWYDLAADIQISNDAELTNTFSNLNGKQENGEQK